MTYRQLLDRIDELEDDQLDMNVMVDVDEEFFPAVQINIHDGHGTLGDGHPYITIT